MELSNGMPVQLVTDAAALSDVAARCAGLPLLALDTEFMRVRTFYARAALFQLCDGAACYLVDPLAVEDLGPLARLLADPGVPKLMHSCSEDLEVCERRLGELPEPLIDTQILAAFCGHGLSVGYQRVIAEELGVALHKTETRTDWLQRPLSEAQLHYAAEDVAYLPALCARLRSRLDATPTRAQWAREECAALVARFRRRDATADWGSIGGAWRLDRRALAVLRALYAWRERTARDRDLPRSWVVPDVVLLRVAERQPSSVAELATVEELEAGARKRHGAALLECVREAQSIDESVWPARLPPPPGAAEGRRLKALRERVLARAEALGVAPEMLARRRELEELLRFAAAEGDASASGLLQGWRREAIGEELWREARA